jgi:hypothetical protein
MNNSLIFLAFLSLIGCTYAECDGSLVLVDFPSDLYEGNSYPVLASTSISPSLGTRNFDVWLTDPQGNKAVMAGVRLIDSDYTVSGRLLVDSSFLQGVYSLKAKVSVLNSSNFTQVLCDKTITQGVTIHTNRSSYNQASLSLYLNNNLQSWTSNQTLNLTFGGMTFPITVQTQNLPLNTGISVSYLNASNSASAINISTALCYDYDQMMSCQNGLLTKDQKIRDLTESIIPQINLIKTDCLDNINVQLGQCMLDKTDKVNLLNLSGSQQVEILTLRQNLSEAEKAKDYIRFLNTNGLVNNVLGMVLLGLLCVFGAKKKVKNNGVKAGQKN